MKLIEDEIKQQIRRVLLYGTPSFILVNASTFFRMKNEIQSFKTLVFNGGHINYSVEIDLNEVPKTSEEWKEHLYKTFYLFIVVSRNIPKGIVVLADPGNEFLNITAFTPMKECPACGHEEMKKEVAPKTFQYKTETLLVEKYITYTCQKCKEVFGDSAQLKSLEEAISDLHKRGGKV